MTIESVTYISDLNASYPDPDDIKSEGDDHIRNIKTGIKTTFPNISGAMTSSHTELNLLDGVTSTTAELNIVDGGTADSATVLQTTDQIIVNDGGTMVQTALTSILNWIQSTAMTLASKTLTSPVLNGTLSGTAFLDENDMASDSDIAVASQQSIKAYVDSEVSAIVFYGGMIDISANNIVSSNATVDAWTMTSADTGVAIVTHNLGTTNYTVVSTAYYNSVSSLTVSYIIDKSANTFTIGVEDENGNKIDRDVEFIIILQ